MTEELPLRTTPTLTLPLKGRVNVFFAQGVKEISFPLRGKVGMGVGLERFHSFMRSKGA
jgi:hypothetical protein